MSVYLAHSYVACKRLSRRSSSSFPYAFLLLPRPKRRAMYALYAFLRRTDDLADSLLDVETRRAQLRAWRAALAAAMDGKSDEVLLPALVDAIKRYDIPLSCLESVIDGVEMDLDRYSYATAAELEQYSYRVASCVGIACMHIWGVRREGSDAAAHACGLAFQWTNILRDVRADALLGRVYLPEEDLRRFGCTKADLLTDPPTQRFRELMMFEVARAEGYFQEGAELSRSLGADGQRVFAALLATYRGLLAEIKRRPGDVLSTRVGLSRWRKLRILTGLLLTRRPSRVV